MQRLSNCLIGRESERLLIDHNFQSLAAFLKGVASGESRIDKRVEKGSDPTERVRMRADSEKLLTEIGDSAVKIDPGLPSR